MRRPARRFHRPRGGRGRGRGERGRYRKERCELARRQISPRPSPVLCRHERLLLPIAGRAGKRLYRRREPRFIQKHHNAAYPVLSLIEDATER